MLKKLLDLVLRKTRLLCWRLGRPRTTRRSRLTGSLASSSVRELLVAAGSEKPKLQRKFRVVRELLVAAGSEKPKLQRKFQIPRPRLLELIVRSNLVMYLYLFSMSS